MVEATLWVAPHAQTVARRVGDQALIVLADRGEVLVINASGAQLWAQIAEGCTAGALSETLTATFGIDRARAWADVETFLEHLMAVGAVVGR